jgi:hypothetical protein
VGKDFSREELPLLPRPPIIARMGQLIALNASFHPIPPGTRILIDESQPTTPGSVLVITSAMGQGAATWRTREEFERLYPDFAPELNVCVRGGAQKGAVHPRPIPVEQELPPLNKDGESEPLLVYSAVRGRWTEACLKDYAVFGETPDFRWIMCDDNSIGDTDWRITHWMPMPPKP